MLSVEPRGRLIADEKLHHPRREGYLTLTLTLTLTLNLTLTIPGVKGTATAQLQYSTVQLRYN